MFLQIMDMATHVVLFHQVFGTVTVLFCVQSGCILRVLFIVYMRYQKQMYTVKHNRNNKYINIAVGR